MNLKEQIGALEVGVDQLLQAAAVRTSRTASAAFAVPPAARHTDAPGAAPVHAEVPTAHAETVAAETEPAHASAHADVADDELMEAIETPAVAEAQQEAPQAAAAEPAPAAELRPAAPNGEPADAPVHARPVLEVARPSQNELTMTIGGQTVSLHPLQVGELIEQLSYVRASMQPEPPASIPPGWRFVTTKNPVMAVQKQSNGDRLLLLRHTGHGWVPFTFSPDMVVQMYMMLTQR